MEKVVVDAEGRVKVDRVSGEMAVTDASGRTVAFVLPPDLYYRMMLATLSQEPTPEELEAGRREYREKGGRSTAEVLAHLAEVKRQWEQSQR